MNNTNLAYSYQSNVWKLPEWNYLVEEISKVFRFSEDERNHFTNSYTAKIIATIPFEAGCKEPERTAIAHLCIYIAEIRGFQKYYAHLPSDDNDIFNRLARISTFEGGNKNIIKAKLLYLLSNIKNTLSLELIYITKIVIKINKLFGNAISHKTNFKTKY